MDARPFVGREAELAELRRLVAEAEAGRGRLVLVTGDAGIGKTRTTERALEDVPPARVFWGRCHETEGAPAYWPWRQVLRAYARSRPTDELRSEIADAAADVAQLVPELTERIGSSVAPDVAPEHARFLLFDAVAGWLRRASARALLVLAFDDLHWADSGSLLLLRSVAGELRDARLVIVGLYRDAEMRRLEGAPRILGELARVSERVPLVGLDERHVAAFVASVGGEEPSPGLAQAIHRATDGNPFFLTETTELLRAEGGLGAASGDGVRIPDTVRDVLRRRLDPTSGETRRVLAAAAVLGREVDLPALAALTDLAQPQVLGLLEPARALGLVVEVAGRPDRSRFTHALVQATLLDELVAAERAALHRRAGEVLERLYAKDPTPHFGALAHHFFEASTLGDLPKAIGYATRAGQHAMETLGFEEAASHFERALRAARAAGGQAYDRLALLRQLGEAQRRAGDEERARATSLDAAELARQLGDAHVLAGAALNLSAARAETGLVDATTMELLDEAVRGLGDAAPGLRSYLLSALARASYFSAGRERGATLARQAVAIAETIGDPGALAAALAAEHFVEWGPGSVEARLPLTERMLELAERGAHPELACEARSWRVVDLAEAGRIAELDVELARLVRDAERLRLPRYRWWAALMVAARALFTGPVDEAEALAASAFALRPHGPTNNVLQFFAVQTFQIRAARGELPSVRSIVAEWAARAPALPIWRCALALVEARAGNLDAAASLVAELAADDFAVLPHDANWLPSLVAVAQVCDALGDARHAAVVRRLLAPHAAYNVVSGTAAVIAGPVALFLGPLALLTGDTDAAVAYLEDGIARAERMGARPSVAMGERDLARALDARDGAGDRVRAVALRASATDAARRLGWTSLGPETTAPAAAAPRTRHAVLRREGDYWTVECGTEVSRLKDTKGVGQLGTLLAHPSEEFHAIALGGGDDGVRAGDAGEVLDDQARSTYARRLRAMEDEIEAAMDADDFAQADALRAEQAVLERELARASGMGGRARRAASDAERARLNVTRSIRAVVKKVVADCPELGRHLDRAVRTGLFSRYEPDPAFPVTWTVAAG